MTSQHKENEQNNLLSLISFKLFFLIFGYSFILFIYSCAIYEEEQLKNIPGGEYFS